MNEEDRPRHGGSRRCRVRRGDARLGPARGHERRGTVRATGFECFEDVFDSDSEMVGEVRRRRRASTLAREELDGVAEVDMEVLHAAGHLERPGRVAEVTAKLAHDRRDGIAGEGDAHVRIEALNRLLTELVVPNMPLVLKPGRTLVVPGHGYVSDYGEVVEYRDMVTVIRDTIKDLVDKGHTLEQVKGANPTKGYRGRYGKDSGPWTTDMFVEAIYNGVKK